MRTRRRQRGLFPAALCVPLLIGVTAVTAPPAAAAVTPVANPLIEDSCGVDLTVVLDASGSVSSSHAVDDVRAAAETLLESLSSTNSTARVTQFASVAAQLAPSTLVDDASLGDGGVLRDALNGYYDPQPPRPAGSDIYEFDGSGDPLSDANHRQNNGQIQYTNWDQSLHQAAETTPELVVYVTDGDPTAFDFDQPGDPFDAGPPPDVATRTDRSSDAQEVTIDRAVEEANLIKTSGARMLAVGVGSALGNPSSQNRLVQIAGPQVVRDADLGDVESLNDIDVALVTDFADLAAFMRGVVLQLCSPSLTIRKLAQTADSSDYEPAAGWDVTVAPEVPTGDGFDWVLPGTAPAASKTLATDANGFAQFQWEPSPPEADSRATVSETLQPEYVAGRPDGPDYLCEMRDQDGAVRVVSGDFADPADPTFDLDPIGQEIVTCTMYNSYDYAPDIALAKVNTPTSVRGDLSPPATVVSAYTVTNPGNTPLRNVTVRDDRCGPVRPVPTTGPNTGDIDPQNAALDPGEQWQFVCSRAAQTSAGPPGGITVVNTATVAGNDPWGTVVTDDATDDVTVFVPSVELTKLVNGQPAVTIETGMDVVYTYAVANTGNTPLGGVVLVDDTAPCEDPIRDADDPGNDDGTLDVGETWMYLCQAIPTAPVVNTATVTATPLDPTAGNAPFAGPNPAVGDADSAAVTTFDPGLMLTKDVDENLVFPGTAVTYSYTATNTGTVDLRNDTGVSGWVTDNRCAPVDQVVDGVGNNLGDTNADDLLNPTETWQFTCSAAVTTATVNLAAISAQPVDAGGTPLGAPLVRGAVALVRVLQPAIEVTKTALVAAVLDPDAPAVMGPDVPTPRPAEYRYDVSNTGSTPLTDVALTDDLCAGVTFADGDSDGDDNLDVEEVWTYTCSTPLEREQAVPAPQGNESGTVTNTAGVTASSFLPDDPATTGPTVSATATAEVVVIEPSVTLTKTASRAVVRPGGEVTYTIVVANTGDVALQLVGPSDAKCAQLTLAGGDTNDDGLLDGADTAPESWTYTCTRAVALPPAPDVLDQNTAGVIAIDPLGNLYDAVDTAQVRVIAPAISLTKTVTADLVPAGTAVGYEFLVRNSGQSAIAADDVLSGVVLGDLTRPANPACTTPALVSKDGGDQDDLLDRTSPEVWRYACTGTITTRTADVAVVGATGGATVDEQLLVADVAVAAVGVFHPAIEIEKTADPVELSGGGVVTYTYVVRNTGDVPLAEVAARVFDDTCAPLRLVAGDTDADDLLDTPTSIFEDALDEAWVFECATQVDRTTTNTVVVEGSPVGSGGDPLCGSVRPPPSAPTEPCDVAARSTATVTLVASDRGGVARLPRTGAPQWLVPVLTLGIALIMLGGGLRALAARRLR